MVHMCFSHFKNNLLYISRYNLQLILLFDLFYLYGNRFSNINNIIYVKCQFIKQLPY